MIGGLVEKQNVRRLDQGFGNRQAFAPAAGERRGLHVKIRKAGAAERLGESRDALRFGNCRAFQRVLDDGANRHAGRKLRNLRDVTESRAFANRHVAAVRFDAADEHFQQRGFAGAIRADHADAIAFGDGERDILEERRDAVSLRQTLRADDRRQISRSSPAHSLTFTVMAAEIRPTVSSGFSEIQS